MKSLSESLFDKDLIRKTPTIGDMYSVDDVVCWGYSVMYLFNSKKLLKYPGTYRTHLNFLKKEYQEKFLGIIMDTPWEDDKTKLGRSILKRINAYIKPNLDMGLTIVISTTDKDSKMDIHFNLDNGIGTQIIKLVVK